ncbi:desulfoferrodoxin FeS4 iron-binding domain-containing protein [Candidatus Shapirobacteria bacterium]|nr:desulfoferrodoxin FeS4 iron-binding domain-containing protein [Candidatus Shapirobacteria bacterium]
MAELNKDYKCNVCGQVVKVTQSGIGTLVCCNQPMEIIMEAAAPAAETTSLEETPPVTETSPPEKSPIPPEPEESEPAQ